MRGDLTGNFRVVTCSIITFTAPPAADVTELLPVVAAAALRRERSDDAPAVCDVVMVASLMVLSRCNRW